MTRLPFVFGEAKIIREELIGVSDRSKAIPTCAFQSIDQHFRPAMRTMADITRKHRADERRIVMFEDMGHPEFDLAVSVR